MSKSCFECKSAHVNHPDLYIGCFSFSSQCLCNEIPKGKYDRMFIDWELNDIEAASICGHYEPVTIEHFMLYQPSR